MFMIIPALFLPLLLPVPFAVSAGNDLEKKRHKIPCPGKEIPEGPDASDPIAEIGGAEEVF
jgi:hypothetical protein